PHADKRDLVAAASRHLHDILRDQGRRIRLEPNGASWQILFTPIRVGGVDLRNRFVFQPHYTALSTFDGMPTDRLAAYYEERARGGAALIVTESQAVHPTGK